MKLQQHGSGPDSSALRSLGDRLRAILQCFRYHGGGWFIPATGRADKLPALGQLLLIWLLLLLVFFLRR